MDAYNLELLCEYIWIISMDVYNLENLLKYVCEIVKFVI